MAVYSSFRSQNLRLFLFLMKLGEDGFPRKAVLHRYFSVVKQTNFNLNPSLVKASPKCFLRTIHSSSIANAKDYYSILGISKNSSQKEIKKAYYELAKKNHPDINKGDPEAERKFQEVSEAYEVLSDETKRKQYDQWGTTEDYARSGPAGGGFQGFSSSMDPEELFRNIFQGFRTGFPESDYAESEFGFGSHEVVMNLTFEQAARGINKDINISISDTCPSCQGNRCQPGTKPQKCSYCNGTGMESITTGPFIMKSTCRRCHGTKVLIKDPCTVCDGKGSTVQRKKVTVPVPAGVEDNQTVRMQITKKKELFITFKVSRSDYFKRDGADVHTDAVVSLSQALLGGIVRIRGLYEEHALRISPGTSSHTKIRLEGKGIKRVNSYGYGDHYVNIKIKIPTKLSAKQKAVATVLAELETDSPGSIDGIVYTKEGKTATTSDSYVHQLRAVLNGQDSDQEVETGRKKNG
ncbi:protein tumorous imaginal discs, mitochondrial-like [Uloborus diversus]|uniref:protein tumorous imaginal discs, mitochondrial-like n=1 Tax=Uloborus diversus TaxID=327109 RepID=UPI0024091CD7|nr:protein tumorous imaginal discs, mitochondrial-like [Uloborus diversus]